MPVDLWGVQHLVTQICVSSTCEGDGFGGYSVAVGLRKCSFKGNTDGAGPSVVHPQGVTPPLENLALPCEAVAH